MDQTIPDHHFWIYWNRSKILSSSRQTWLRFLDVFFSRRLTLFPTGTVEYCKNFAVPSTYETPRLTREKQWIVQKGPSSPALRPLEGKAAAAWTSGAYGGVREHGQGARTPLAAFFNTPHWLRLYPEAKKADAQ